ncbi:AraC family transcriptional regulator [Longimicrobium terrae]|uniref:AraC-like DNA-binding protein n=1 Tax=Longimicrobium terrae TaxID=1639882 RepID=A0A841GX06_9BACT|nr:AraC family transcriptional regulator [Longimicrobium terrae]MBB4634771.1 AraC-like DNA-binding protein [Longimicrobium terrae]MBB6069166.1 AraC-like DNA-binding protein [Longimicrobium terrae]NNC32018.1 AraC family transcriptional regulator [Longimicrobium terrae]
MTTLMEAVRRHAEAHSDSYGLGQTPIPGLTTVQALAPGGLVHAVMRPLVCLVLQGTKHVTMGTQAFSFGAGDSMLITADVPTVSQITRATAAAPYLSLVLELDLAVVAELAAQIKAVPAAGGARVRLQPTDTEVADAALRLMRLLDRPETLPVLQTQMVRELHYWLLAGRHGADIQRLGWPGGHAQRIARAVTVLREEFARPLRIERLAATAGMSPSSFHQHFRAVTSLSPLQFQKHLRLIEARRLMLSEGKSASAAAYTVGYESVPQFTREYGRMFGLPPMRETAAARSLVAAGG